MRGGRGGGNKNPTKHSRNTTTITTTITKEVNTNDLAAERKSEINRNVILILIADWLFRLRCIYHYPFDVSKITYDQ